MEIPLLILSGFACGILSGMGVGGGSLLIILLTQFLRMGQLQAQFMNLLYFIPIAVIASRVNSKNGFVDKKTALVTALSGILFAYIAAVAAGKFEPDVLRKIFGVFLIIAGGLELVKK